MQWFVCLWFVCFAWITTSISVWLVYTYQLEWVNSCHDVLVSTPYCYCLYFISQHLNVTRVWMFHNKHACASRKALSNDAAVDVRWTGSLIGRFQRSFCSYRYMTLSAFANAIFPESSWQTSHDFDVLACSDDRVSPSRCVSSQSHSPVRVTIQ